MNGKELIIKFYEDFNLKKAGDLIFLKIGKLSYAQIEKNSKHIMGLLAFKNKIEIVLDDDVCFFKDQQFRTYRLIDSEWHKED